MPAFCVAAIICDNMELRVIVRPRPQIPGKINDQIAQTYKGDHEKMMCREQCGNRPARPAKVLPLESIAVSMLAAARKTPQIRRPGQSAGN
jgi:hypothetical protein